MDNQPLLDATARLAFCTHLHDLGRFTERDKQIKRVIPHSIGKYGEISGIFGGSLPDIPALTLKGAAGLLEE